MYLTWGSYTHPDNEIDISSISVRSMYSQRNRLEFKRWTMTVQGEICTTDKDELTTRLRELQEEYNEDYRDVILHRSDGTHTAHALTNANSINGVRVMQFSYPKGGAGEYATGRTFSITFQADYLDVEDDIYSFNESLTFIGTTGPQWELVPTWRGTRYVERWPVTPQTIYQDGSVIGLRGWPHLPPRLFGEAYEHLNMRMVRTSSPRMHNRHQNLHYPLNYRYVYSTHVLLNGYPAEDYPGIRT